jgi:eukaryotic-like serine/threonine-protein kinase
MTSNLPTLAPELLAFQAALAGRYSIERELGRGGMGIVFLAREVALDRLVALKLLPPELAARPGVRERFLREARTAARLSHPNIVQIYSVDEVDGFVFFAMAFVDGGTLGERIRDRGPLSNSEASRLLREVSWALGHAHLQGVVHRDVKPDNILLDATSGRALVTDFGIAVVVEEADQEYPAPRQAIGTAEFMSPEQAKGGTVGPASDLYSLACVGFYALSGQFAFTDENPSAVLVKHVDEAPPTVLSAAPHATPIVASALDRCLRKDPEKRFASGEALADALGPEQEAGRELAVPLRVFIKQTRDWETIASVSGLGSVLSLSGMLTALGLGAPGAVVAASAIASVATLTVPVLSLARAARRLMKSGFTRSDGIVALLRDIERKEEEFRFQVGERETRLDRFLRRVKWTGIVGSAISLPIVWDSNSFLGGLFFGTAWTCAWGGLLIQEIRARMRGDLMGERLLRLWKSKVGRWMFDLGGLNLKRVAPALSAGIHRATEVVIGLEADRLFEALPEDAQQSLEGLPETVQALEADAQAMRKQVAEMETILAEIGDDDPSRPSARERSRVRASVEATRAEAKEKLQQAVAALETIRLGLLYMQAGTGTVESLTMELQAARSLSDDMDHLLAGHREVERILHERRETGVFRLVTDPGGAV